MASETASIRDFASTLIGNVEKVIVGKRSVVELTRVHGRAADLGRRRHLWPAKALHRAGDAESNRIRGDVSAAGGAARPFLAPFARRLPGARRRAANRD